MRRRNRLATLAAVTALLSATAAPAWATRYGNHDVHGSIELTYLGLGGPSGVLRLPLTDETPTPDGVGRYNVFQGGSIYWSPATAAVEVQGLIRDRWAQLGWERGVMGYPIAPGGAVSSAEESTPDGVGRVSRFQGGDIYYTPATGAHEVRGSIFTLWASLNYEQSTLGYPTSGEYAIPGGRRSDFQGGHITWTPTGGTTADVDVPAPTGPSAPVPAGTIVLTGTGSRTVPVVKPAGPMLAHLHTIRPTPTVFGVSALPGALGQPERLAHMISGYDAVVTLDFPRPDGVPTTGFAVQSDTSWEIDLIPLAATGAFDKGTTIGESRSTVWHYVGGAGRAHIVSTPGYAGLQVFSYDGVTKRIAFSTGQVGLAVDITEPIGANQYLEIVTDARYGADSSFGHTEGTWTVTVS